MLFTSQINTFDRRKPGSSKWTIFAVIIVVFFLLFLPLFIVLDANGREKGIVVDGQFKDWKGENFYKDSNKDCDNPSVNIIEYGIAEDKTKLSFYLKTKTEMHNNVVQILIDTDRNKETGYSIIGMGADFLIEINNKFNNDDSSKYYQFDNDRNKNDWNAWEEMFGISSKTNKNELEAQVWLDDLNIVKQQKILVYFHIFSTDIISKFYDDFSDAIISNEAGALIIDQDHIGNEILTDGSASLFLNLTMRALEEDITINSIVFKRIGTANDRDTRLVTMKSGNMEFFGKFKNGYLKFDMEYTLDNDDMKIFYIIIDIPKNIDSTNTIGMKIHSVETDVGAVTIPYTPNSFSYISDFDNDIIIDGGFKDWTKYVLNSDNNDNIDNNIDIREYKAIGEQINRTSFLTSFYLKVDKTMMEGTDIPTNRSFYEPSAETEKPDKIVDEYGKVLPEKEKELLPEITGEDKAFIFLDIDKNVNSGYLIEENTGAEYLIKIKGRYSEITTELYRLCKNNWVKVNDYKPLAECDETQLEVQLKMSLGNYTLHDGINIYFKMLNWKFEKDYSDNITKIKNSNLTMKTRADDDLIRETQVVKQREFFSTKSHAHSVCYADVDEDNDMEIVIGGWAYQSSSSRYKGQLSVWQWNGIDSLKMENIVNLSTTDTSRIYSIDVLDINNDNEIDIVVGGIVYNLDDFVFNGFLQIWNIESGSLTKNAEKVWGYSLIDDSTDTRVEIVELDDVDSDGTIEIITAGYVEDSSGLTHGQLGIWNYDGNINNEKLDNRNSDNKDTYYHSAYIGDIDKDNKKDIVIGGRVDRTVEYAQLRVLNWYNSVLSNKISSPIEWNNITDSDTGDSRVRSVCINDVDGNGKVDIITGGWGMDSSNNRNAQLIIWNYESSNLKWKAAKNWVGNTGNTEVTTNCVADYDKDGTKEILTGGYSNLSNMVNAQMGIFYWDGKNITNKTSFINWNEGGYTIIFSLAIGDVDGDGILEIITAGSADNTDSNSRGQQSIWSIPEFSSFVFPIIGMIGIFAIFRRKKYLEVN